MISVVGAEGQHSPGDTVTELNPYFVEYVHRYWGDHDRVAQHALDHLTFILGRVQTPEEKVANLEILRGLAETLAIPEAFLNEHTKLAQRLLPIPT
jgi:hypothetical protein